MTTSVNIAKLLCEFFSHFSPSPVSPPSLSLSLPLSLCPFLLYFFCLYLDVFFCNAFRELPLAVLVCRRVVSLLDAALNRQWPSPKPNIKAKRILFSMLMIPRIFVSLFSSYQDKKNTEYTEQKKNTGISFFPTVGWHIVTIFDKMLLLRSCSLYNC